MPHRMPLDHLPIRGCAIRIADADLFSDSVLAPHLIAVAGISGPRLAGGEFSLSYGFGIGSITVRLLAVGLTCVCRHRMIDRTHEHGQQQSAVRTLSGVLDSMSHVNPTWDRRPQG